MRDVEVSKSVAVVVADGDTLSVSSCAYPSLLGDIGEGAIAIVAIQRISQRWIRIEEVALSAIDEIYIHPPVVVVVEECAARTGGFGKVLVGGHATAMDPRYPAI